jgi:uncharacterized protein
MLVCMTQRPWLLTVLVLATAWPAAAASIPPVPRGEDYLYDDAGLVSGDDEGRLRELQRQSLAQFNSPLVVVTISRLSDYSASSIESLALQWFNAWNIGTLGLQGGANQGILLIVSAQDRKARIELGADWGQNWNDYAKDVMDNTIVPRFKKGDYSGGIVDGATKLLDMAKRGPHSQPPGGALGNQLRLARTYSALPPLWFNLAIGVGVLLIVLSFFFPQHRWKLLGGGVAIILTAVFTYIILIVIALAARGRRGSSSWGSGGGGGGFSGGFSGGGGASGSW